eukprot:TRINITY_DN11291_c0_g2_i3.p1 TRINITY_DN11291_c0_g2~~TRINITY_DN11291_c0_g2_i3.p1  ORF type:complete len:627 (+),score=89.06 TRINITY_DN11291_c0_g2_i3:16-1896(+)
MPRRKGRKRPSKTAIAGGDSCPHIDSTSPSILVKGVWEAIHDPTNWSCQVCATTESVWACLHCKSFACGREAQRHALNHYKRTRHPLVFNVQDTSVYCYTCDRWLTEDDSNGTLQTLRDSFNTVKEQFSMSRVLRSGRVTAAKRARSSAPMTQHTTEDLQEQDKLRTADQYYRESLLRSLLHAWKQVAARAKRPDSDQLPELVPPKKAKSLRGLHAGMTGLRNLGQTCYMNAVLQAISHVDIYRNLLFTLGKARLTVPSHVEDLAKQMTRRTRRQGDVKRSFKRQTTVQWYEHMEAPIAGLSRRSQRAAAESASPTPEGQLHLTEQLESWLRIAWKGKFAVMSPNLLLTTVWRLLPHFHGFKQQDAHEALVAIEDEWQNELATIKSLLKAAELDMPACLQLHERIFRGLLQSCVTCKACGHVSQVEQPFGYIALELDADVEPALEPLINHFLAAEDLGGSVYHCEACSLPAFGSRRSQRASTSSRKVEAKLRPATKQLHLETLPQVIKFHLKRFHWQGRDRTKISKHVAFSFELDMGPYMGSSTAIMYDLVSLIVHEGRSMSGGHYKCYAYNPSIGSWVVKNDARVSAVDRHEIASLEAYLLFYVCRKATLEARQELVSMPATPTH